jgi:hypothetical protein
MKYALLIWHDENKSMNYSEAERQENMAEHYAFMNEASEAGVMLGGEALHPAHETVRVQSRAGKVLTTDGPFAETKESMGGFYLINCETEAEAYEWASKIPEARVGTIEVRKIMEF